jgi:hypothetical protein
MMIRKPMEFLNWNGQEEPQVVEAASDAPAGDGIRRKASRV